MAGLADVAALRAFMNDSVIRSSVVANSLVFTSVLGDGFEIVGLLADVKVEVVTWLAGVPCSANCAASCTLSRG